MWQVLLAAAVAGSTGLVAKHILGAGVNPDGTALVEESKKCDESCEDREKPDGIVKLKGPIETEFGSPVVSNELNEFGREGIFRFSSSGSRGATSSRHRSKKLRKKTRIRYRGGVKEARGGNGEMENCTAGRDLAMEPKKSSGRFSVCLKKRRTSKNSGAAKTESCSSKDDSLFHWGIGVGIMYMMSAGKAEINKLNVTVDETAKVVRELKSELYKRKYSRHVEAGKGRECNTIQPEIERSSAEIQRLSEARNYTVSMFDDGECESSVLTEEPDPEIHDMDQLEAELATELEKLPWCSAEDSCQAGALTGLEKTKVSSNEFHGPENLISHTYPSHGVVPAELDQKLCHLLIEQQEHQIGELESELNVAQSKLNEKEAELQALKDCVRRLTEFSLTNASVFDPR
ncbi:uncharacterized protein LOC105434959 isoform X2 [Cucumis sativus]|uniref:uncharacterized protein LOC105434959 isoform X2 n=1 Tax=Cucumis sativus TaxID=3659 RepID=UPI0012F508AD|nr:uncharacterized protein LOC105434959 isoform X2 [Cucumis sativus]